MLNLLGISGSLRAASLNSKLLHEAIAVFGDANVTIGSFDMPLYNGDIEETNGVPEEAVKLAQQIDAADAVILACPEYNQGIPGVVKNGLDWVSRVKGNPWAGKPVAFVHATAGRTGGARANYALRLAMAPFHVDLVSGPEILVASAQSEIDAQGKITNQRYVVALTNAMAALRAKATG